MKKLILTGLVLVFSLTGCSFAGYSINKMKEVPLENAKETILAFINGYLVKPDSPVTLSDFKDASGVYQMDVNLTGGQKITAYMTKDGKYFFSEGMDIEKEKEARAAAQNSQAPADPAATGEQVTIETLTEGNGEEVAKTGDLVTVNYTGTLADGTVFDTSIGEGKQPITFPLGQNQVIKGWEQGIPGMKIGEKRKLVIPPSLAYGEQGMGSTIPPNSTLTFEVELMAIKSGTEAAPVE